MREERRLKEFKNRVMRKIFGVNKGVETTT
jgi:hypothetical protein